jgi:XTP/dITP diphosphohydrolase
VLEALDAEDPQALCEELGDLLLQVAFHARIAQESGQPWDIDDVADGIVSKLVRRHPHVFAGEDVPGDLEAVWHARKTEEKGRESVTDAIPMRLPALLLAAKVLSRSAAYAERLGATRSDAVAEQALWEVGDQDDFGRLLLALVAAGRTRGWDAESALRSAVRERMSRVREAEGLNG